MSEQKNRERKKTTDREKKEGHNREEYQTERYKDKGDIDRDR